MILFQALFFIGNMKFELPISFQDMDRNSQLMLNRLNKIMEVFK